MASFSKEFFVQFFFKGDAGNTEFRFQLSCSGREIVVVSNTLAILNNLLSGANPAKNLSPYSSRKTDNLVIIVYWCFMGDTNVK